MPLYAEKSMIPSKAHYVRTEAEILTKLLREDYRPHPNIVELVCFIPSKMTIIIPFYEKGTIFEKNFEWFEIKEIAKQMISALLHVHSKNILHFDVKPENIFWDGKTAFLGDFAYSQPKNNIIQYPNTRLYASPELLECFRTFKKSTSLERASFVPCKKHDQIHEGLDWFSLGLTLAWIASPQNEGQTEKFRNNILHNRQNLRLPKPFVNLLDLLLVEDAKLRRFDNYEKIREILFLPFFRGVDWSSLLPMKFQLEYIHHIRLLRSAKYNLKRVPKFANLNRLVNGDEKMKPIKDKKDTKGLKDKKDKNVTVASMSAIVRYFKFGK